MNQASSANLQRASYALATIGTVLALLILATGLLLPIASVCQSD